MPKMNTSVSTHAEQDACNAHLYREVALAVLLCLDYARYPVCDLNIEGPQECHLSRVVGLCSNEVPGVRLMSATWGAGKNTIKRSSSQCGDIRPAPHHEPDALHAEILQDVMHRGVLPAVVWIPERPVGIHCVIPLLLQQVGSRVSRSVSEERHDAACKCRILRN
jgi:hypothetical protein